MVISKLNNSRIRNIVQSQIIQGPQTRLSSYVGGPKRI